MAGQGSPNGCRSGSIPDPGATAMRFMAWCCWLRRGSAWRDAAGRGRSWVVPSMVGGGVRLLTEGRRESAHVAARRGSDRSGTVSRGTAGQVAAGLGSARFGMATHGRQLGWSQVGFDSLPGRGPQGLTARHGGLGRGGAGPVLARHGERYWQTPGFKSPERTARKGSRNAVAGSGKASLGIAGYGLAHGGSPGGRSPGLPHSNQSLHQEGYQ